MVKLSNSTKTVVASGLLVCALVLGSAYSALAQADSLLGTAQSFAVLGGETVTNTGATTVEGDLGVSPGSEVTGFAPSGPGIVTGGTIHIADEVASQAQSDVTTAYNTLAGYPCESGSDFDLTGQDLGGLELVPGVYCFSSSAQLTGTLTLNAGDDPDALFVFQIGSTLTTASESSVLIIGGSECNVFWQVGSSATLGTTTSFQGNILALTSITLDNGASVIGRALARNGAVTMDTNDVSAAGCAVASEPPTATPEEPTATPEEPTATPEDPTATPVEPTATPDRRGSTTPTTAIPAPATSTPVSPGAGGPAEPTPTASIPATATPVTPDNETATPALPFDTTPTAPVSTPETPVSPATATRAAATPVTQTPVARSTSTAVATATPVAVVKFPNTGSGGLLATQNDRPVALANLAATIAIVILLTAGVGTVVEWRSRR